MFSSLFQLIFDFSFYFFGKSSFNNKNTDCKYDFNDAITNKITKVSYVSFIQILFTGTLKEETVARKNVAKVAENFFAAF